MQINLNNLINHLKLLPQTTKNQEIDKINHKI